MSIFKHLSWKIWNCNRLPFPETVVYNLSYWLFESLDQHIYMLMLHINIRTNRFRLGQRGESIKIWGCFFLRRQYLLRKSVLGNDSDLFIIRWEQFLFVDMVDGGFIIWLYQDIDQSHTWRWTQKGTSMWWLFVQKIFIA